MQAMPCMHAASLGRRCFKSGQPGSAAPMPTGLLHGPEPGRNRLWRQCRLSDNARRNYLTGKAEAAITAYAKPLADDDQMSPRCALNRALVLLHYSFDHKKEAAAALIDEWLQYYPEDEEARYFEQILAGAKLSRAPPSYVAQYFDRMSEIIDAQFLRRVDYQVPEQMTVMLAKAAGRKFKGDLLDAGCGHGALGPHLKPFAASLTGIDLSPRMAALAKASGFYGDVATADLLTWLQGKSLAYDLVAAADSLIYFGALEFVFAAAHAALRPGGWFMFNVETGDGEAPYVLTNSGRFRHTKAYVVDVGTKAFMLARDKDMLLRLQGERPVQGTIFLFQKA